jgi:hypothetical protein
LRREHDKKLENVRAKKYKVKSKTRRKITGWVVGLYKSMLSPEGIDFALYRLTIDTFALRKRWHMSPKMAAECT